MQPAMPLRTQNLQRACPLETVCRDVRLPELRLSAPITTVPSDELCYVGLDPQVLVLKREIGCCIGDGNDVALGQSGADGLDRVK